MILIAILALSVLLRVGVAFYLGDSVPPHQDETSYSELATRLVDGYGYSFDQPWYPFTPANTPTAHWSFLYTAFVAALYGIVGVHPLAARLAGAVLAGVFIPLLLYLLSRRVFLATPPPALTIGNSQFTIHSLSAFLAAIYAYFLLYSAMVQTEALFICALLWSMEHGLAVADRLKQGQTPHWPEWLGLGVSLGLATLFRQSILPWVVVLFAWLLWIILRAWRRIDISYIKSTGLPALFRLVLAGLVLIAFVLPFTVLNYRAYGSFLLLNSNAGYAMYSAQHPMHGTSFQEFTAAPLPDDLVGLGLNEAQWDKELMRRGIGFILAEPGRYTLLSLSRVHDYFEFWPTADSSLLFNIGRVLSIGLFLPFILYGLYLSLRRSPLPNSTLSIQHSSFSLLYLFIIVYSLMHILTWAMSRYRLPVDAVLLLFAALGIMDLAGRLTSRRQHAVV